MTFEISKKWCRNAAIREDGFDIGAGVIAADPVFAPDSGTGESPELSETKQKQQLDTGTEITNG